MLEQMRGINYIRGIRREWQGLAHVVNEDGGIPRYAQFVGGGQVQRMCQAPQNRTLRQPRVPGAVDIDPPSGGGQAAAEVKAIFREDSLWGHRFAWPPEESRR